MQRRLVLPASDFISPQNSVLCGWKKCLVKVRFIDNQPKWHWCHYSFAITMCNQHFLHNDMWKQKKCPNETRVCDFPICGLRAITRLEVQFLCSYYYYVFLLFSNYLYNFYSKSWLKCAVGIHVKMGFKLLEGLWMESRRCRVFWQTLGRIKKRFIKLWESF